MKGKRVQWHDDWLREHAYDSHSYQALVNEYNKTFGTNVSKPGIKNHCRYALGIEKPRKACRHFTEEQLRFLSDHYEHMGNRELLELFNSTFNEHRTMHSIKNFGHRNGVQVDKDVKQANRRKWLDQDGSKRKTRNTGDIRIEVGRPVMKDENGDWKSAAKVVWEKEHGPVPEGYVVTALDGDCFNISPDNLACVPVSYMGLLQRHELRSTDPEITKTAIIWCELVESLKKKEKGE